MKALVQCLIDWLNENRSDAHAWRIVNALARDTLKRADSADPSQREFDAQELVEACQPEREWDYDAAKRWFSRAKVELFLEARQAELQAYFRGKGHHQAIAVMQRKTTGRHRAPWYLNTYDLPTSLEAEVEAEQEGLNLPATGSCQAQADLTYEFTPPKDIKLSILGRLLLGKGTFVTRSTRGLAWAVLMLLSVSLPLICLYLLWAMRLLQRPLMTSDMVIILMLIGGVWVYWRFLIRPWVWLLEDRIIQAGDVLCGLKEDAAQLDMARDATGKSIRLVRFGGVCPVCAGRIELRYGVGSNARRLFGCCQDAPHDHVFTFDRVTHIGQRYVV